MQSKTDRLMFPQRGSTSLVRIGKPAPIMEFNLPEGTFKLDAMGDRIVMSGSLTPTEAAAEFFERVGQHVLAWIREHRN